MPGKRFSHSGMDNRNWPEIPAGSKVDISGMGKVTIGNINANTFVDISGMGKVVISGIVDPSVMFNISGMGNVVFTIRPPQVVIDSIVYSGMGKIDMPGGFNPSNQAQSDSEEEEVEQPARRVGGSSVVFSGGNVVIRGTGSSFMSGVNVGGAHFESIRSANGIVQVKQNGVTRSYRGNSSSVINGRLIIDGREVTANDPRLLTAQAVEAMEVKAIHGSSSGNISQLLARASQARQAAPVFGLSPNQAPIPVAEPVSAQESKLSPEEVFLRDCSTYTRQYIVGFEHRKKASEVVAALKLSPEELELLEESLDPISLEIMDRPVILNETVYDLKTVLSFKGLDPNTRLEFSPANINPSRATISKFEKIIKQIEEARKPAAKEVTTVHVVKETTTGFNANFSSQDSSDNKITSRQRNAASLYWTLILTGEVNPKALQASKQGLLPFMATMEAMHRRGHFEELVKKNPTWSLKFMNELDALLVNANSDLCLRHEYHPEGIIKEAAEKAGIPETLFPVGKLSMRFDKQGNIIVGDELINAETLLDDYAKKRVVSFT